METWKQNHAPEESKLSFSAGCRLSALSEQTKHVFDIMSVGTVLATLAAWLPPLAALMSILWTVIRIYETPTFQRLLSKLGGSKKPAASETSSEQ